MSSRATVVVLTGPGRGRLRQLAEGESLTVGRQPSCELAIEGDSLLSGRHLSVSFGSAGCTVRDLDSTNGSFVCSRRIEVYEFLTDVEIEIGESRLKIRIENENPRHQSSAEQDVETKSLAGKPELSAPPPAPGAPFLEEPIRLAVETCPSGLERLTPLDSGPAAPEMISRLMYLGKLSLLVEPQPARDLDESAFEDCARLYSFLGPAAQEVASPLWLSPAPGTPDPALAAVGDLWGTDSLVCLFSGRESAALVEHLRTAFCPQGPDAGVTGSRPSVLALLLRFASPEIASKLSEPVSAVLLEDPENLEGWQVLCPPETLPSLSEVRIEPLREEPLESAATPDPGP